MEENRDQQDGRTKHQKRASLVQQLGTAPVDAQTDLPLYSLGPFPPCTEASNLRRPGRHFTVITTAALPWRTGPAVNALLRALYLAKRGCSVVLVLPWVDPEDQEGLFLDVKETFENREEQEAYIRKWCNEHVHMDIKKLPLELRWYNATYQEAVRSIFPQGDCSEALGDSTRDVLILEEPEHLCWYHNGRRWTELFNHVVGVVHTNYSVYLAGMGYEGILGTPAVRNSIFFSFTSLVCRAYCDITVKLSDAGIALPNVVTCNVNGVRKEFLDIGRKRGKSPWGGNESDAAAAYFVGKAVIPKGWGQLLSLLEGAVDRCADVRIDAFGSGPDWQAIHDRALALREKGGAEVRVSHGVDHTDPQLRCHKVLVNPSTSEMLCTVTAEAIAMRKRAVLPRHPSNSFFADNFADRCHFFKADDVDSFVTALQDALAAEPPPPLTDESSELLSWEAAVERLCASAEVHVLSGSRSRPSEVESARLAYEMHRRFQKDSPAVANMLKGATLKSNTSWEDHMVQWLRETESGRLLLGNAEEERALAERNAETEKQNTAVETKSG